LWIDIFEFGHHVDIADGGVLDDLGKAFPEFTGGESEERFRIDDDEPWLMETTDEVFSFGRVDACFTSDCRVDLGDDGGGDLHKGNAAIEDRSDESGKIADDATTESDDEGRAIVAVFDERPAERSGLAHRLG
jgi:hypothetical protein